MVNIDDPKPLRLKAAPPMTPPHQSIENVLRLHRAGPNGGKPESARAQRRRLAKESKRNG